MFYKGMDISSLPEHLEAGDKFYDAQGNEKDPFELIKENGVNSVRLRIWNEPKNVPESKGYCDLAYTVQMAKRIKANGMHFMLDFHYSDYWADPGQQNKPKAWANLSFEELTKAVYDFTHQVLTRLKEEAALPDIVQVGNEIRSGMLFPDGAVPNYKNLAILLNAGITACRDISSDMKVMIHLDQGGRFYYLKEWFDAVFDAGLLPIDAIGISFYSFWHGTFMDLRDSMTQLKKTYGLPVYVVETAHPWRICPTGHVFEDIMKTAGLPAGIDEQKQSLSLVLNIAAQTSPEETGVYYWEPLCLPGKGYGSWEENMGMLDENGAALPGLLAYRDFEPGNEPEVPAGFTSLDAYMESLYAVDESLEIPVGINLIQNGDFTDGLTGFWTEMEPKNITVETREDEIYVAGKENFVFAVFKDVFLETPGDYRLSVSYRGTNTTGVHIFLYAKVITCNGETLYQKEIFPQDVNFMTYSIDDLKLEKGTVQVGIRMETPPVFGRIKALRLEKI